MGDRDIVVIGTSAGGLEPLRQIARDLPSDLNAAVFVVMHLSPRAGRFLEDVLGHEGPLPAGTPGDGDTIRRGRIYVAPADHHLILEERRVRVVRGPKQNRHRPAVDVLFRSAAFAHGPRVIGVVLTGALDDGAAGLAAIKRAGGVAVVQDPSDAAFPSMPQAALAAAAVDHTVPADHIGELLVRLTREHAPAESQANTTLRLETRADQGESTMQDLDTLAKRSSFTCPNCHGSLWELTDAGLLRYRCHVGHGFTAEGLMSFQDEALEGSLWAAVRALEESANLKRRVGERVRDRDGRYDAELRENAKRLERHAARIRELMSSERPVDEPAVIAVSSEEGEDAAATTRER